MVVELRQPRQGRLELEVVEIDSGSEIRLTASFDPEGLLGNIYWYLVYPFHDIVFAGMLRKIASLCDSSRLPELE